MDQSVPTPPAPTPDVPPSTPTPPAPTQAAQAQPMSASDVKKILAIIGYIVPILFFLPLVMDNLKNDASAKFHANQQLNLLLYWIICNVATGVLAFAIIGIFLAPLVMLGGLALMIIGVINAAKGAMKPLPIIGGFTLLH